MTVDYYAVLKVSRDAPPEVIRASYAALIRQAHPDIDGSDGVGAGQLNEAKYVLLDPVRRAAYDASLDARSDQTTDDPTDSATEEPSWGQDDDWGASTAEGHPGPAASKPTDYTPVPPPYPMGHTQTGGFGGQGGYQSVPTAVPKVGQLWAGATTVERWTGWAWLALSLIGPVGVVVAAVMQPQGVGSLVGNLLLYAALFALSFHVAQRRIMSLRLAKRYVVLVGLGVLLAFGSLNTPIAAAYFAVWTGLFVAATESRRRRVWPG